MVYVSTKQTALGSNRLLDFLQEQTRTQFIDYCEVVSLNTGEVIGSSGDVIHYIYFPIEGIISWEKQIESHPYLVVTLIGNEGMLCISLMLDVNITPCRAVVQKSGYALRIVAADFLHQIQHHNKLNSLLKRYVFVTYSQLLQKSACNLFHLLESRLANLILMFQDQSQSDELHITQELLSQMLGVRRVGVTKAAGSLQRKNLISYSRGNVVIHDTIGLKAASCLCYQADQDTYAHILDTPAIDFSSAPDNDEMLI